MGQKLNVGKKKKSAWRV